MAGQRPGLRGAHGLLMSSGAGICRPEFVSIGKLYDSGNSTGCRNKPLPLLSFRPLRRACDPSQRPKRRCLARRPGMWGGRGLGQKCNTRQFTRLLRTGNFFKALIPRLGEQKTLSSLIRSNSTVRVIFRTAKEQSVVTLSNWDLPESSSLPIRWLQQTVHFGFQRPDVSPATPLGPAERPR